MGRGIRVTPESRGSDARDIKVLSSTTELAQNNQIVRSGSIVVVTWTDGISGKIMVRVSTNGGSTFKTAKSIDTTTNQPDFSGVKDGYAAVALGGGAIQVAYLKSNTVVKLRRSTDNGTTWKTAQSLATNAYHLSTIGLAASGSKTVLAYNANSGTKFWIAVRRSTDKGAHWTTATRLTSQSTAQTDSPLVAVTGTTWRIAWLSCPGACVDTSTVYLASSTIGGSTWGAASPVSRIEDGYAAPAGVAFASNLLVMYSTFVVVGSSFTSDILVRQGG